MPWKEVTKMSSKKEFVLLAQESGVPFSELCRRYKISRKTGYKLIDRYEEFGESGLEEQSRRPLHSPNKTSSVIEAEIIKVRTEKPYWGGRKIRAYLLNKGSKEVPLPSTITSILKRHGLINKSASQVLEAPHFFEHELPNDLWQADFKGHFAMREGRCHPLTVLDDHSRYSIGLKACSNERRETVQSHFIELFKEFGLPWRINFDNGSPWGSAHERNFRYTEFTSWLIRLGIRVSFSRPHHPQTNGKDERFHRTLKTELLQFHTFWNLDEAQTKFNKWREEYNLERPHEALQMKPPISRYKPSNRAYPEQLPPIEYPDSDIITTVNAAGNITFLKKKIFIFRIAKRTTSWY
jgi:transposase InsO family protein